MAFQLVCVYVVSVQFGLLGGRLLWSGCSLGWPGVLFGVLTVCNLLVSGFCFWAWFGFWLLRFLVFAYFLL